MTCYTLVESPIDPLLIVSEEDHLTGLYMSGHKGGPQPGAGWVRNDSPVLKEAERQLEAYFAGELREFHLPLRAAGTPFQQAAWAELCRIPYGETISYGELATRLGSPNASRAVGLANGRNPISIIVPCHRVIGASGSLTGYGGGLERKAALLDFERDVLLYGPHPLMLRRP